MSRRVKQFEEPTDLGNARRFVAKFGDRVRFTRALGWLTWDGRRWRVDETGEVIRLAKKVTRSIIDEAKAATDEAERTRLLKHAIASQQRRAIMAMVDLASSEEEIALTIDAFDRDPWLLTTLNGTLNLQTGELRAHDPADLITKLAPVTYDPTATCPRWEKFLREVLVSDELVAFLSRAIGYSLTGITREQCLFFQWGSSGSNGKGTIVRTIQKALGDYFRQADFSSFLERRSEAVREDLADLVGSRMVAASEAKDGKRLAEGLIKTLTGEDDVSTRKLHHNRFTYRPAFKLWLSANHRPVISGDDHAIWRRIHLIPFTVEITSPDFTLEPALQGEELAGILAWAVRGCLAWQREGLGVPNAVREATREYRQESDVLGRFLAECCEEGAGYEVLFATLYATYESWCQLEGIEPMNKNLFGRRLSDRQRRGSKDKDRRAIRLGIRLRSAPAKPVHAEPADDPDDSDDSSGTSSDARPVSGVLENRPNRPEWSVPDREVVPPEEEPAVIEAWAQREEAWRRRTGRDAA